MDRARDAALRVCCIRARLLSHSSSAFRAACGLKFSFFSVSEALMPLPSKQAPISTSA